MKLVFAFAKRLSECHDSGARWCFPGVASVVEFFIEGFFQLPLYVVRDLNFFVGLFFFSLESSFFYCSSWLDRSVVLPRYFSRLRRSSFFCSSVRPTVSGRCLATSSHKSCAKSI